MNMQSEAWPVRRFSGKGSPFLGGQENIHDGIKITLVANAGVLVEHNGIGLLMDGIHHEEGYPFSQVSENDMELMRQGADIFANLDYLLFTHEHPDHFTPQYVSEHIRLRSAKGVFLPNANDGSPALALLLNHLEKLAIPHYTLGLEPGKTKRFAVADDLVVTVIGTRHMGPQYQAIRNDCFLLTLGGKNLLFTGDADYVAGYFENALAGVTVDAVFVNPIFYHNSNGQEIINEVFRPRDIVIYHMPFEEDDTLHFSHMVTSDIDRHGRPEIQTHVLSREKESIYLSASS